MGSENLPEFLKIGIEEDFQQIGKQEAARVSMHLQSTKYFCVHFISQHI